MVALAKALLAVAGRARLVRRFASRLLTGAVLGKYWTTYELDADSCLSLLWWYALTAKEEKGGITLA